MITIRWTSAALIFVFLYAAYLGARGWGFAALLAALILTHLATYRTPRAKRAVSNWFASDDPKYGELDQQITADHKKDLS